MEKQRLNYVFLCLLLLSVVASITLFSPIQVPQVLAQTEWTDTFNVYTNVTVLEQSIRTITNTYDFPIDIKVYITATTNIAKLALYKTVANNTEFINIENGEVVCGGNTYSNMQPTQNLVFDLLAKPAVTLGIGEAITIVKKVEIYSVVVPPPPPPPKSPLDLKITQLPAIVYQPFQPTFTASLLVVNKGTVGTDVTIKWWITDVEGKIDVQGATTMFVEAKEQKELEILVHTPKIDGAYTLHTQSTIPTVVVAEAKFQVTTIPIWLIVVIILIILTMYIMKKKH
jgi:hypothetical protein